eukprot:PLAT4196.1.p1 GENE.PLAT4196.1~~PLAT4196.1.p1  ORF type:complete len:675 (+),score=404.96 PLAT4196.1:31-2025(+)
MKALLFIAAALLLALPTATAVGLRGGSSKTLLASTKLQSSSTRVARLATMLEGGGKLKQLIVALEELETQLESEAHRAGKRYETDFSSCQDDVSSWQQRVDDAEKEVIEADGRKEAALGKAAETLQLVEDWRRRVNHTVDKSAAHAQEIVDGDAARKSQEAALAEHVDKVHSVKAVLKDMQAKLEKSALMKEKEEDSILAGSDVEEEESEESDDEDDGDVSAVLLQLRSRSAKRHGADRLLQLMQKLHASLDSNIQQAQTDDVEAADDWTAERASLTKTIASLKDLAASQRATVRQKLSLTADWRSRAKAAEEDSQDAGARRASAEAALRKQSSACSALTQAHDLDIKERNREMGDLAELMKMVHKRVEALLGGSDAGSSDDGKAASPLLQALQEEEEKADATHVWHSGEWSQCDAACGSASRTRAVTCTTLSGDDADVDACNVATMPADKEACDVKPCPTWQAAKKAVKTAPLCADAAEEITLSCPSDELGTYTITSINGLYGDIKGSCAGDDLATTACHGNIAKFATATCVGHDSCTLAASVDLHGEPCTGVAKTVAATATCAAHTYCVSMDEGGVAKLTCPPAQRVREVTFASYGTPTGSCGNFAAGSCHADSSLAHAKESCDGQKDCAIDVNNGVFGEPCAGTAKSFAAHYTCERINLQP